MEIIPLSKETVEQAIALVQRIFAGTSKEDIRTAFEGGLGNRKAYTKWKISQLKYWVIVEDTVIATTGMYELLEDKDAYWAGWMCVDPEFRRRGLGRKLLEFVVDLAKKAGKKYVRLYTSTDPNEAAAQKLYEKRGFKEYKREPEPGTIYERIYRQLDL